MPDITSITAAVESVKFALGIAKDLKNATDTYSEAEHKLKVSELYSSLSEARISLADAQEEIHALENQVAALQAKLDASDDLEYRDSVYWRIKAIEGKPNGPFCPKCYEGPQKKTSSMSSVKGHFSSFGKYKCNTCSTYIK